MVLKTFEGDPRGITKTTSFSDTMEQIIVIVAESNRINAILYNQRKDAYLLRGVLKIRLGPQTLLVAASLGGVKHF